MYFFTRTHLMIFSIKIKIKLYFFYVLKTGSGIGYIDNYANNLHKINSTVYNTHLSIFTIIFAHIKIWFGDEILYFERPISHSEKWCEMLNNYYIILQCPKWQFDRRVSAIITESIILIWYNKQINV